MMRNGFVLFIYFWLCFDSGHPSEWRGGRLWKTTEPFVSSFIAIGKKVSLFRFTVLRQTAANDHMHDMDYIILTRFLPSWKHTPGDEIVQPTLNNVIC